MNSHTDSRNQPGSFDPVSFTVVPPRRFEDLRVGDVFRAPSRTVTDGHAAAFQTVSADNHPIHYDVEYAVSALPSKAMSALGHKRTFALQRPCPLYPRLSVN